MANPVFSQTREFQERPGVTEIGMPVGFDTIEGRPDVMTYEGTIVKAASLFLMAGAAAVLVGMLAPFLALPLMFGAFILSLVVMFATRNKPNPVLQGVTLAMYGGAVGGISVMYEATYGGIILQALTGTAIVFAVALAVYRSGRIRNMGKINKFLAIAVPSYVIFMLVNMGMSMFAGFNVRDVEIAGINMPLGVVLSVFAIFVGGLMLISDFDFVASGVRNGLPSQWEWTAAYGLVFSIIWIYLEMIRLLGYLRR